MKKLDHLNDGIQEGQGSDSSHADEEPSSAAVSHFKSTRPKSGLFICRLARRLLAGTECINKEYSIPHGIYLEIEGKGREHAWASYVFNIEEYIKLLPHFK